jgi:hypothetical protein
LKSNTTATTSVPASPYEAIGDSKLVYVPDGDTTNTTTTNTTDINATDTNATNSNSNNNTNTKRTRFLEYTRLMELSEDQLQVLVQLLLLLILLLIRLIITTTSSSYHDVVLYSQRSTSTSI